MPSRRLVKLFIACSLDGYIAGPNGELDWLFDPGDFDFGPFFQSVDVVVMGRKTYDFALSQGHGVGMPGTQTFVFTRSPPPVAPGAESPDVEFRSGDPAALIAELRTRPGKHIWLMGGGDLAAAFLGERLVDEMQIVIHPTLLGAGIPLFPGGHDRVDFDLVDNEYYDNGLVALTYRLAQR